MLVDFVRLDSSQYGGGDPEHLEKTFGPKIQEHMENIRQEVLKQLAHEPALPPPETPPEHLKRLLDPLRPLEKADSFYVSSHFITCYKKLDLDTRRAEVYRAMCNIWHDTSEPFNQRLDIFEGSCRVSYVRFQDPQQRCHHIYLIGLVSQDWEASEREVAEDEIADLYKRLEENLLSRTFTGTHSYADALSQLAKRSFPAYLLASERLWQKVWQEREVFLPLSTEEMNRLQSILTGEMLPCVIEGRSGSGKSTLLIYYTAERLAQTPQAGGDSRCRALFVSHSNSLLEKAKDLIQEILRRLKEEYSNTSEAMEAAFLTYHDFARAQLPEDRRDRFLETRRRIRGGYIDFPFFADLLRGRSNDGLRDPFGRSKDCSPEVVWFTLRSYIKGYKIYEKDEERWMTPDEYADPEEIAKKDRQVSEELYREVWHRVWPWYRRLTIPCSENNYQPAYWDNLDLAWEVLEHRSTDAPEFDVLVCDESQDFTRVEIASLLRALKWSKYNLRPLLALQARENNSLALPIVFAGDAHQTVNPSCFRWGRVSADISQSLTQNLPNFPAIRIPALELHFNYRNAPSIAQLCNAIQHLRQVALGQSAALQNIWHPAEEQPNLRVRRLLLDHDLQRARGTLESLLKEGVLVIGPVPNEPGLGGTSEFWKRLGFQQPPSGETRNYVVTADIKGLEQDLVAVAGFGVMFKMLGLDELWNWKNAVGDPQVARQNVSKPNTF